MRRLYGILFVLAVSAASPALTVQPSLESGTVMEAAERLKPGEYLWAPGIAPKGPVLLVVSLATQRAVVYRNGLPIGISTVSTGRPGYRTPTGVFTILQKHVEHYSNLYNDAPMPYMQRLTWGGVALHGGDLPGYPASHGCIRLPHEFARLLYSVTHRGMTVVVTDRPTVPHLAPEEELLGSGKIISAFSAAPVSWYPERSPAGPLSIIMSAADRRLLVLRNGILIGSSVVEIQGKIARTSAFVLNSVDEQGPKWLRVNLPGQSTDDAPEALRSRIQVPQAFRGVLDPLLVAGTTVIVTGDSLQSGQSGAVTVIEDDQNGPPPEPR